MGNLKKKKKKFKKEIYFTQQGKVEMSHVSLPLLHSSCFSRFYRVLCDPLPPFFPVRKEKGNCVYDNKFCIQYKDRGGESKVGNSPFLAFYFPFSSLP